MSYKTMARQYRNARSWLGKCFVKLRIRRFRHLDLVRDHNIDEKVTGLLKLLKNGFDSIDSRQHVFKILAHGITAEVVWTMQYRFINCRKYSAIHGQDYVSQ